MLFLFSHENIIVLQSNILFWLNWAGFNTAQNQTNLNYCSIKIAHCVTYVHIMTLGQNGQIKYIGTVLANTTSQYSSYSLGIKVATIATLRWSFKNYVEKMRWVSGPKTLFVSTFRVKMSAQRWVSGKKEQNYVHIAIK